MKRLNSRIGVLAMLIIGAGVAVRIGYQQLPWTQASQPSIIVECSSVREGTPSCDAVRPGVRGDWISNGEGEGAWVKYTFDHPVRVSGVSLANRGTAGIDITDGHIEFDSGQYPPTGGIGGINHLTDSKITFPRPVLTTTVKFVVDRVESGVTDVGLAVFGVDYVDPVTENLLALTATCSQEHPGGFACTKALRDTPGAWWTPEDGAQNAWIEVALPPKGKHPPQPVLLKNITINEYVVTDANDNPDNIVLDGHFELKNGDETTRWPAEGGVGPLAQYRDKGIPIDPPVPITAVRFIVDKIPPTNSHIGIDEFDLVIDPTRLVMPKTDQYIAVVITSDGSSTAIESTKSVVLQSLPRSASTGLYALQAIGADEKIIGEAHFTPIFRDIITTFTDNGPEAASVQHGVARSIVFVPYHAAIHTLRIVNALTAGTEVEQEYVTP